MTPALRSSLIRAFGVFAAYAAWTVAFRLLAVTLVTWFLMGPGTRLQDLSDFFGANELAISGASATLFVVLLVALNPLTHTSREEILTVYRVERRFLPGFLTGAVLAGALVAAFLFSGLHRYLGSFIGFEEAPLALVGVGVRAAAILALAWCEEFVFRARILPAFRQAIPLPYAIVATSLTYCAIKALQFDLGWMSLLTLFLVSVCLSLRAVSDGDFARGAGFWAAILVVFHPLLSLPVLGDDFQGILMIKFQDPQADSTVSDGLAWVFRHLCGGYGGPLSSMALQALLVADAAQVIARRKRLLLK